MEPEIEDMYTSQAMLEATKSWKWQGWTLT